MNALEIYKVPKYKAIIQSFDEDCVKRLNSLIVSISRLLISRKKYWYKSPNFEEISDYANFINPNYKLVNSRFIKNAHSQSLKVIPYTVNKPKTLKNLSTLA